MIKRFLLVILCIPLFSATAQDSLNVSMLGWLHNYWDLAYETEVEGSYAYCVTRYTGLRVVDISDPLNPFEVGSCETSGSAFGLALSGNYAYVADGGDGLRVIDITDPFNPFEVGFYDTPGNALGVAVSGNIAYVANETVGLILIDVSNPSAPAYLNTFNTAGMARNVLIEDTLAFVADDSNGLRIIDISDPMLLSEIGFYDSPGHAQKTCIAENFAYLADGGTGLRIVDISNPALPNEVGYYDTPGYTYGVAVRDSLAYLADGDLSLRILKISDPAAPVQIGYRNTGGNSQDVFMYGDYAILSDKYSGLRLMDVSVPTSPFEAGAYDTPGHCINVEISEGYAYIADVQDGMQIVDVSDPANPLEVGRCATAGWVWDVAVSGSYAYVADNYGTTNVYGGLRIIDITNPAFPVEVGFCDSPGNPYAVAVTGNYAYLADGLEGLRIVNISNPFSPVEVGFLNTPGLASGVDVLGDLAFIADGNGGLRIVDIANPTSPEEVGVFDEVMIFNDVVASEDYAYLTFEINGEFHANGLAAVDVSDPAHPFEAGNYTTPGNARGLDVVGDFAFIADDWAELLVINILDPAEMTEAGHSRLLGGSAYGVASDGCLAYQAAYRYFEIFDCSAATGCLTIPEIQDVSINGGDEITDLELVSVAVTATNEPRDMMLSEDPAFDDAAWQTFTSPTPFTLSQGNGMKTVYVRLRNAAGVSESVGDDIQYLGLIPDPIDDLCIHVDPSTNSVILTWNSVDNAEVYKIYAGASPSMTPNAGNYLHSTPDTFYVDPVSLQVYSSRFYLVTSSSQPPGEETMVWIPAGEFVMGNNQVAGAPEHTVYLDGYYIDAYEVTNAQYREFCILTGYPCFLEEYFDDFPNHPLIGVRWDEACAYCEWLGKRLPTEAEWERAAKGNEDNRLWPWGDNFYQEIAGTIYHANIDGTGDGWETTAPIGSFPTGVSPTGCFDMAGNVNEHCWDYYSEDYYSMSPDSNPQGPESGTARVRRGGAYHYNAAFARCSNRYWLVEGYRGSCSFRCVKTP
ncbi:SUMF1/EgtB/PvdO family nonheme iron enzyme [bacterium]|nr:SUMF1/EgtB/PvdO family nonheme iron enzyme [bacterium]